MNWALAYWFSLWAIAPNEPDNVYPCVKMQMAVVCHTMCFVFMYLIANWIFSFLVFIGVK